MSDVVATTPDQVFDLVTDVQRLPEWNAIIGRVVEHPARLEPGVEWVVELTSLGSSWRSRSQVLELDRLAGRFAYRSRTDDGNPSYGDWLWQITDDPGGSRVAVEWELYPRTFWRRVMLAPMRNRQLRKEVRGSLRALERRLLETRAAR